MPTVREIAQSLRAEFISSNIYRESRPYLATSTPIRPTIADILLIGGYPQGYALNTDPNETIYTVGQEQLANVVRQRVGSEALDEVIPSSISIERALKGQPLVLRADDYRITRKQRIINIFERVTGVNTDIDPFTESDRQLRSSQAVDDKYFEFTGSFQKILHLNAVKQNYFSIRTAVERDEQFRKANRTSTYYLNKRLQGSSKYYSSYVYLDTSIEGVRQKVASIPDLAHQSSSGIGSVLSQAFLTDDLAKDGEFGETPRPKTRAGDCVSPTLYNIGSTHSLNHDLDATDPSKEIVWGATTLDQIENTFGAKRGLLNFTGQIVADNGNSVGQTMDMTKTCYNRRGEIVFKGTPCRSWTYLDYYGKTTDTFIRGFGNQVENSVAKDYVHPKIHPTVDGNGIIDNRNMMFSFENLAYTKQDLIENNIPECEWGPRYGRLMWFPPYIKRYSENTVATYNPDKFVGRGERLYTYSDTERTFSITFMLIMDYPFWMDKVGPIEMARIFSCELDRNQILQVPEFGETTLIPPTIEEGVPNPIELPPIDLPSIIDEAGFGQGAVVSHYFENDIYNIEVDYEHYADTSGSDTRNLFALNSDFYNSDPNDPNVPDQGLIDALGSILGTYKRVFEDDTADGVAVRDFYNVTFVGNASSLFVGLQTGPAVYNRYLSYRRAFALAIYFANRYGIPLSSLALSQDLTDASFLSGNPNLRSSTLADFNPDRMFPPNFPGKGSYYRIDSIGTTLVFAERKADGSEGIKLTIVAEGSNNSLIEVDDDNKDSQPAKIGRNVQVIAIIDQDKVNQYDEELRRVAEEERLEEIARLEAARVPLPPIRSVAEIRATADDELNCTQRFLISDPIVMGYANYVIDPMKLEYGFRKNRKFAPAFHSQTPEDFHRRLTFLRQLMYTGKSFSEATARNSVFGRAPFAVMRIGDFYHTKLVIKDIGFDFADTSFDLNPEGMGIQPMTCSVTMNGTIIGGQSLKGPIEKIQNAVSFNHFANSTFYKTGMYAKAVESEEVQAEIDRNRRDRIDKATDIDINGI